VDDTAPTYSLTQTPPSPASRGVNAGEARDRPGHRRATPALRPSCERTTPLPTTRASSTVREDGYVPPPRWMRKLPLASSRPPCGRPRPHLVADASSPAQARGRGGGGQCPPSAL